MLRTSGGPAKPDIQRAVEEMLRDDTQYDRAENRSAMREHLVRPVSIKFREIEEPISAFSRNISATGIGLITDQPVGEGKTAVLAIKQLRGPDVCILAECRWCKSYGENWHLSGWQFINLKR